jgi:signal transduction histidine kinase
VSRVSRVTRRRLSLRTRLVAAFVLVALTVLTLSGLATYGLVRRSLQENALSNLRARSADLSAVVTGLGDTDASTSGTIAQRLARLRRQVRLGLRFSDMRVVAVSPDGSVHAAGAAETLTLPPPLTSGDLDGRALLAGDEVSGRKGNTVYLAQPTQRIGRQTLAVVATDTVDTKALRRATPLLIAAALVVLAIAILVSIWLARRLTRPINEIERAASQLASGDLSARADVPETTDDELAALATTLNEMAAQLEQARGGERAFLLSISHDLRTPLTSIRGYAEALADGVVDPDDAGARRRAAEVIAAEARRLERLVSDLLDLSRLDSRQFSLRSRPGDATAIVRDAAEAFVPKARDLGITLAIASGAPIPVDLDPERLGQIVANLVENALKYATSRVEVYATPHEHAHVAIVVTDDGPGIPTDELGRVFDRLYTVRSAPGRAVGTGLGLAIVRELTAAMGGQAWADAAPSGGSRFVVSLPTRVATPEALHPSELA